MKPHAFVAMPFGIKTDAQGNQIDFNSIYTDYILSLIHFVRMKKKKPVKSVRICFLSYL